MHIDVIDARADLALLNAAVSIFGELGAQVLPKLPHIMHDALGRILD